MNKKQKKALDKAKRGPVASRGQLAVARNKYKEHKRGESKHPRRPEHD